MYGPPRDCNGEVWARDKPAQSTVKVTVPAVPVTLPEVPVTATE